MTPERFAATRQPFWQELEGALAVVRRGRLRNVSTTQIERFGTLARHAASDLAIARRDFPEENVTLYLNGLCARCQPLLAGGDETRRRLSLPNFFLREVPRIFRAAWPYMLLSLVITLAGAAVGALEVAMRPDLRSALVPSSLFDLLARHDISDIPDPVAGSWAIILNNIMVSMFALLGGFIIGLPTAYFMFMNGLQLGTLGAAVHIAGYDRDFWPYLAAHGMVEMSVVVLAGGAGFMVAGAMLRPGQRPRREYVPEVALRAAPFCAAVAMLLIGCGILEGFVSPSGIAPLAKVAIGATYAAIVYAWLLLGGRRR